MAQECGPGLSAAIPAAQRTTVWGSPLDQLLPHTLRQRQGPCPARAAHQACALGVQRRPPPIGGALKVFDGVVRAARAVFASTPYGGELVQWPVTDGEIAEERPGKRRAVRASVHEPWAHRVRGHLDPPGGGTKASALRPTRQSGYDACGWQPCARNDGARGCAEVALPTAALQLPPRPTAGLPSGRDSAEPRPAAIATVGSRAARLGGVDWAPAAPRRDATRRRGARRLTVSRKGLRPGVAVRCTGEPRKELGLLRAFSGRDQWLRCGRARCSGLGRPPPREPQEHPAQGAQHALGENEVGSHDKAPAHKWCKGPLYRVVGALALPARYRYTTVS
jgi:hypothetical protein